MLPGMGTKRMSSQGCTHSKTRLQNYLGSTNRIVTHSHNTQRLRKSTKRNFFVGLCTGNASKEGYYSGQNECKPGVLQQVVSSFQTRQKWRPVIDLSVLNSHFSVPTFKMETAEVIRNSICKGEWVVSVDLTDAYFHVPIHQKSHNLLCFHVG